MKNLRIVMSLIRSEENVSFSQNPKTAGVRQLTQVHLKRAFFLLLQKKGNSSKTITSEFMYTHT